MHYRRVAQLRTAAEFRDYLNVLGITLPFDEQLSSGKDSLLAQPISYRGSTIGNRFSILPMEGWDGTTDGRPSEMTIQRWQRFGISGAKGSGAGKLSLCRSVACRWSCTIFPYSPPLPWAGWMSLPRFLAL